MGIINDHRKWLPFIYALHTSADTCYACQPMCNIRCLHSHTINRRNRSQAITDIEMTDQLCLNIDFSTGQDGAKTCTICIKSHVHGSYCCRLGDFILGDRKFSVRPPYPIQPIIPIGDCDWVDAQPLVSSRVEHLKKPRLGTPVLLDCLMEIQVFMRDIGDNADIKVAPACSL